MRVIKGRALDMVWVIELRAGRYPDKEVSRGTLALVSDLYNAVPVLQVIVSS